VVPAQQAAVVLELREHLLALLPARVDFLLVPAVDGALLVGAQLHLGRPGQVVGGVFVAVRALLKAHGRGVSLGAGINRGEAEKQGEHNDGGIACKATHGGSFLNWGRWSCRLLFQ
jgi:hypothetical protein